MSRLVSIGSTEHIDFIRNKLEEEIKSLLAEDVFLKLKEYNIGNYTFWDLDLLTHRNGKPLQESKVFSSRYAVAKLIADLIVNKFEKLLLKDSIGNHYQHFTLDEQEFIFDKSEEMLTNSHSRVRINNVAQSILEYLETEEILILKGFMRFRLKNYLDDLSETMDRAADEYLMEKEYNDFVHLLKYFVDIQEPKVERIHVFIQIDGLFQMYDGQDNVINNDYLEKFIVELADNDINHDDLLISTLITLAPREVVLHLTDASSTGNIVNTIESIFEKRVFLCAGCSKCINIKKKQKKP